MDTEAVQGSVMETLQEHSRKEKKETTGPDKFVYINTLRILAIWPLKKLILGLKDPNLFLLVSNT